VRASQLTADRQLTANRIKKQETNQRRRGERRKTLELSFEEHRQSVSDLKKSNITDKMKRKVEQQPSLKLYYFNIKGKGEPIRLFCAYAGLELVDHRFAGDEFSTMKENGRLAFGQVPMLEVDGKHQLVQSSAILRYLSKIVGLYPADPLIAARVDAALDQEADAFTGTTVASYTTRFGIGMDADTIAKAYEVISTEVLPRHLENVEKLLTASETGWIAGTEEPSAADFVWFVRLSDFMTEKMEYPDKLKSLEDFPALKAFVEKVKSLEAIKEYYEKK
jgi:glutathione S-transferase